MPDFTDFDTFKPDMANKVHDLSSDTLKLALSTVAPSQSADTEFSDITEITAGNGYTAGGETLTGVTSTQASGTYTLNSSNVEIGASGGSITYRYAVLYNDTSTNDKLIGFLDEGSTVVIPDGSKRTFTPSTGWIVGTSS
jgi:hypothetical protein